MSEQQPTVIQVSLRGDLDLTSAHAPLENAHRALRDTTAEKLIVDVSQVGFVDSSGLGGLVRLSNYAESRGIAVFLSGATPRLRSLLQLSGLATLLPVID